MNMWIEELKNGKYKYVERYKDESTGKWRKVSLTSSKHNARIEKEMTKRLLEKIEQRKQTKEVADITFSDLANKWLHQYKKTVKPSSYNTNANIVYYLINEFSNEFVSKLTVGRVNQFLLDESENIKYRTLKNRANIIIRVLDFGVRYGYIETNQLKGKLHLPKVNLSEDNDFKFLDHNEIKKVISCLEKHKKFEAIRIVKIMISTGLRLGELSALKIDNINFEEQSLYIDQTYSCSIRQFLTPKTGKPRTVYFNDSLIPVLKEQIKYVKHLTLNYNLSRKPLLLFKSKKDNPLLSVTFNNLLHRYVNPYVDKKITSHIFRHTFITLMIEKGVQLDFIARQVGHTDTMMIQKVYGHITKDMEEQRKQVMLNHSIL